MTLLMDAVCNCHSWNIYFWLKHVYSISIHQKTLTRRMRAYQLNKLSIRWCHSCMDNVDSTRRCLCDDQTCTRFSNDAPWTAFTFTVMLGTTGKLIPFFSSSLCWYLDTVYSTCWGTLWIHWKIWRTAIASGNDDVYTTVMYPWRTLAQLIDAAKSL